MDRNCDGEAWNRNEQQRNSFATRGTAEEKQSADLQRKRYDGERTALETLRPDQICYGTAENRTTVIRNGIAWNGYATALKGCDRRRIRGDWNSKAMA